MAYLDNTVITVDAVLTKKGRERLGQGRHAFNIAKFAVSDDEIDYSLYNTAHPLGSNYFSNIIESMPVLEAIPDESQTMMYKLLTLEGGSDHPRMPYMSGVLSSYILSAGEKVADSTAIVDITPITTHWDRSGTNQIGTLDATAGYTFILFNENSVVVTPSGTTGAGEVTRVTGVGDGYLLGSKAA